MIYYIIRTPLSEDPRMQKYVLACKDQGIKYKVLSWDRLLSSDSNNENELQFKKYMPYGCGRNHKFLMVLWGLFVWKHLMRDLFKYRVIHTVNIENYLLSIPFKLFGKKVFFDIYDCSSSFSFEPSLAAKSDLLILPHLRRLNNLRLKIDEVKNLLIIENTPVINFELPNKTFGLSNDKIRLSYVGTFERNIRGIENVLEIVEGDSRFILDIAGSGVGLEEKVKDSAQRCTRIHYHGKVSYPEALKIMNESDFIVALYYILAQEHKWACPNKICESLFLSTPVITSDGTLVGAEVKSANVGYVLGDSKEDFMSLFDNYGTNDFTEDYQKKVQNCKSLWNKKYANYFEDVLIRQYIEIVKNI